MKRKLWLFLYALVLTFILIPSSKVHAEDNAYVSCLYDAETMCYRTSVIFSGDEVEFGLLKRFYEDKYCFGVYDKEKNAVKYINGDPAVMINAAYPNKFCNRYILSETYYRPSFTVRLDYEDVEFDRTEANWRNQMATTCTFPTNYHHNATQADINRAYEVADILGGDLTSALIFLNDEKSYLSVSNNNYLWQVRYYLVKGLESESYFTNSYGSRYLISPKGSKVVITKLGHFEEWDETAKDWKQGSFVDESKQISRTFTWRMRKGYKDKGTSTAQGVINFTDGNCGVNSLDGEVYNALNVEQMKKDLSGVEYHDYITWVHLLMQADLAMTAGITYQNSIDLYGFDSSSNVMINKIVSALDSLESSMDCYSISDLVFNHGVFATEAYFYGCFPATWLPYINVFYLIFSVVALSMIGLSLTISVGKNTISSASANARFTLMQDVMNLFISALCIVVGLGLIHIMFYISDLIVSIFSDIVDATGRTIEGMQPIRGAYDIPSALMLYGYFGLKVYINVTYVIRRFLLMGLISAAPIFIIAFSFGPKGREIAMRWMSELIGHITIQPVQAATFAVILTVTTGLRGVESVALLCCILPLTNFYRGLITKGGNFAVQYGSKIGGSLIGQQAASLGAQAMAEATEEGKEKGHLYGSAAAIVGAGVGILTGNPFAAVALGASAYSAVNSSVSESYKAQGQMDQAAFQTGGAMANMVASGGEDSGVTAGINSMVNARVAQATAEVNRRNAIAGVVGSTSRELGHAWSNKTGVFAGGGSGGPSSGGSGGSSGGDGGNSGISEGSGAVGGPSNNDAGENYGGGSVGRQNRPNIKNNKMNQALKESVGGGTFKPKTDKQTGEVSGGTVTLPQPKPSQLNSDYGMNYAAISSALRTFSQAQGAYNPGSDAYKSAFDSVTKAFERVGMSGVTPQMVMPQTQTGGDIKIQIDTAQMNALINSVNKK